MCEKEVAIAVQGVKQIVHSKFGIELELVGNNVLVPKELDLVEVQKEHLNTSNKLWALREDYLSLLIDFDRMDYEAIKETRKRLKEEVAKVYNHAPITDEKSYTLAQEELQKKESQFFTRDELNNILPIELRK